MTSKVALGDGRSPYATRDGMADRDWCATCARKPCRRYERAQRSGKRWCMAYEYANREVPDDRR